MGILLDSPKVRVYNKYMLLDEPEGKSFEDLRQFLGSASALGTAINIQTNKGDIIEAFLYYTQNKLPKYLQLFHPIQPVGEDMFTVSTEEITWFKLKRNGKSPSYIYAQGTPTAVMPIIILASKEIKGAGKVINPGVTSIQAETIKGDIKILTEDEKSK